MKSRGARYCPGLHEFMLYVGCAAALSISVSTGTAIGLGETAVHYTHFLFLPWLLHLSVVCVCALADTTCYLIYGLIIARSSLMSGMVGVNGRSR